MKKFFTLIAFTSAFVPAIYGMETSLPADTQKKYDHLIALIKNVDVKAFKSAFNAITLPAESLVGLEQSVVEAKEVIAKEIAALGDENIDKYKLAKCMLALVAGTSGMFLIFGAIDENVHGCERAVKLVVGGLICWKGGNYFIKKMEPNIKENLLIQLTGQLTNLDAIAAHIAHAQAQAAHA